MSGVLQIRRKVRNVSIDIHVAQWLLCLLPHSSSQQSFPTCINHFWLQGIKTSCKQSSLPGLNAYSLYPRNFYSPFGDQWLFWELFSPAESLAALADAALCPPSLHTSQKLPSHTAPKSLSKDHQDLSHNVSEELATDPMQSMHDLLENVCPYLPII